MHRKSLEAAEALKNEESGNSDRDETTSKGSDISSTGTNNNVSKSQSSIAASSSNVSDGMSTATNGTLIGLTSPSTNGGSNMSTSSSPPPSAGQLQAQMQSGPSPSHQMSNGEASKSGKDLMSMMGQTAANHQNAAANFHPDQDPEAFRWVNYNRDPITYIR